MKQRGENKRYFYGAGGGGGEPDQLARKQKGCPHSFGIQKSSQTTSVPDVLAAERFGDSPKVDPNNKRKCKWVGTISKWGKAGSSCVYYQRTYHSMCETVCRGRQKSVLLRRKQGEKMKPSQVSHPTSISPGGKRRNIQRWQIFFICLQAGK